MFHTKRSKLGGALRKGGLKKLCKSIAQISQVENWLPSRKEERKKSLMSLKSYMSKKSGPGFTRRQIASSCVAQAAAPLMPRLPKNQEKERVHFFHICTKSRGIHTQDV